jgi:hypothetical protein
MEEADVVYTEQQDDLLGQKCADGCVHVAHKRWNNAYTASQVPIKYLPNTCQEVSLYNLNTPGFLPGK